MKIALAVLVMLLSGCAVEPINTEGLTFEERMQIYNQMRLNPRPIQYYPMPIRQHTQTRCTPDGIGGFNCATY